MFRGSSRSRGEAPVAVQRLQDTSRENSNWRPALRRIKKGLFSKSAAVPENSDIGKPEGTFSATGRPLLEIHQQRLNERNARPSTARQAETQSGQQPGIRNANANVLRKQRPVPMGPREPNEPSRFNFVQRSMSRSGTRRKSMQEPREPIFVMRDVKRDEVEIISAGAPSTAAYIPRHAASDLLKLKNNQQQNNSSSPSRKPVPTQTRPKTAAYEPKHAASDFSKLNLPFNLDSNGLAQYPSDPITSTHTNTTKTTTANPHIIPSQNPDSERDDYQRFLKASRLAAAGNYNSYGVVSSKNFTPKTSQLMQDYISNRQSMERERAYAISQRSSASRPVSRAGSIFDRVAEYVKPGRAGSVRTQRAGFTGLDGEGSFRERWSFDGERVEGAERQRSRWSWVGGSLRRSFSKGRDGELDKKFDGDLELDADGHEKRGWRGRKRRSRAMPVSPGLKKFNQAVRERGY
ncbi:hypothetical protein BKA65DRAFT_475552 [Rhexocercosporidium sp. MPI-PUGE-AT-0058]|nr:hypothetical protein BKA65DRAFT_475552 [Rhexocercosporidium sp. MPI-PUGE-AT-0058]